MNRIQIYILRRAFKAFLLCLLALIGVVWLTQALQQLDLVTSKGQTLFLFLQITWLVLPKFVAFIAPVAVFLAALYTLNSLNNDSELVIVTNSGASPFLVLKPLLVLAVAIALLEASIGHYFSPKSQQQVRLFFTEINSDLISSVIKPGEFASIDEGITFYVGSRDGSGIFKDVFVADDRDSEQSLTYLAKTGAITRTREGTFFVLQNGTIHRRPTDRNAISVIDYTSYAFDLSTFERKVPDALRFRKPSENFTPYLLSVDEDNPLFVRLPGRFFAELHSRFAAPLYSIAYVLIVFVFLGRAQSTRQGRGLTILTVFLAVPAVRGVGVAAQSIAEGAPYANALQYLVPLGTIALCLVLIIRNVEPRGLEVFRGFGDRIQGLLQRLSGPALNRGGRS